MDSSHAKARLFISLTFSPQEHLVTAVSRLVSDFCRLIMASMDTAWRFYMAAQELAENITKYSTGNEVTIQVEMENVGGEHVMRVYARNETSPERLQDAVRRLDDIKSADDPVALYDQLVLESAPHPGISGLGLARIRAESELDIDYTIEGSELTICVQSPVRLREGV